MNIDKSEFMPIDNLSTSNVEDLDEVIQLAEESRKYLESKKWCKNIVNGWYALGWGYMLGIFYYEIEPDEKADPTVWIIVGDLPPAYIDIESATSGSDALLSYVELMEDWIENIENGGTVEECFPVGVPPTKEHASMLKKRMTLIREEILS